MIHAGILALGFGNGSFLKEACVPSLTEDNR